MSEIKKLEHHEIMTPGNGRSAWVSQNYCNFCEARTGTEEFLTEICETCGRSEYGNCTDFRAARTVNGRTQYCYEQQLKWADETEAGEPFSTVGNNTVFGLFIGVILVGIVVILLSTL